MKTSIFIRSFIVASLFMLVQPSPVFSASFTKGNMAVTPADTVTPFDGDKLAVTYDTQYSQLFNTTWDNTTFYNQWMSLPVKAFSATDIAGGSLQFAWATKRALISQKIYYAPYLFETELDYSSGSNRGGVVIRFNKVNSLDDVQEPVTTGAGFNSRGIAFYPTADGNSMIVQFTGEFVQYASPVTRILVPKPAGVTSLLQKGKLRIEDFGTSIYVYYNDVAFCRISLADKVGFYFTSGTVYDANMSVLGTFTNMHVDQSGQVSVAQRDATLRLYSILIKSFKSLSLASLFNDNMVLQQNMPVALWGWAAPNASVAISASWGQTATATADAAGKWATTIQTPPAVTGSTQPTYTLTFTAPSNTITVSNILIGDVYFASGQSNMGYGLSGEQHSTTELPAANYPNIRYCAPLLNNNLQQYPLDYAAASWNVCTPANAKNYSAVAYYFAKELHIDPQINIPIGLVVSSVGGTYCEQWTSREALTNDAVLKSTYLDKTYSDKPSTSLYNGQIAPYIPFSLKGFIWYQGESNTGQTTYTRLFSAMINDWRSRWGQGNLPFYFVQLAPYINPANGFEVIREQQANTLVLPNTGMVVITDIGDLANIHPANKLDVGKRLSLWAKAKIYGEDIVYTGPLYKSMKVEGSNIRISFHPASIGSGLEAMGGGTTLNEFVIGGADNIMVSATAVIDGNDVLVSATSVPNPTNVWFAYKKDTQPTLRNKNGLPASPFRTNGWDNAISIPSVVSETISPKNSSIRIVHANGSTLISGFPKGQILRIYNLLGVQVYSQKVAGENVQVSLPNGIYLMKELGKPFLIQ